MKSRDSRRFLADEAAEDAPAARPAEFAGVVGGVVGVVGFAGDAILKYRKKIWRSRFS